jgi:tetratricopeptide (TPR) repeat protein
MAMIDYATDLAERSGDVFDQVYAIHARADIARKRGDADAAQLSMNAAAAKMHSGSIPAYNGVFLRHELFQSQVWAARGKFARARKGFTGVLAAYQRRDCCAPAQVLAYLGRAEIAVVERQFDLAVADVRSALAAAEEARGKAEFSCFTGSAWLTMAHVREAQGETAAARAAYELAARHLEPTLGADNAETREAKQRLKNLTDV